MIRVNSEVKIKALPVSLKSQTALVGMIGVVKEIDTYFQKYPMYVVDLGIRGVLVFGSSHIEALPKVSAAILKLRMNIE